MISVMRDKAWARRFARHCGGDLGITHAGPRYRFPIRIWTPTRIKRTQRTVTVPADRVVKDCPQPDPPEYRPIQYGSPSRADRDVPATPVRASPSMAPAHGLTTVQRSAAGTNCTVEDGRVVALNLDGRDLMQAPQPF